MEETKSTREKIPEGWVETTLGEIVEINPRESLKKGQVYKSVPMDSIDCFTRQISRFQEKEFKGGTKFRNGDTLFARITPCLENGKTVFVDFLGNAEVGFGSTEYIVIREKNDLSDRNFLYYLAISPYFREVAIKTMTGTSGRQRVQTDVLAEKNFYFPPLPEQRAIADVLSSFDDKIELLREQNKTLEQAAQTIFKEWFGKYSVDRLDEFPEGWKVGKLSDIASHHKESIKPYEEPEKVFAHYSLPSFDNGLSPVLELGSEIRSNKYSVLEKSFLVSKLNPFAPRIWTILEPLENSICSTEFQVVKPKKEGSFLFMHCFLNSRNYTNEISKKVQGTSSSHQRVKPQDIFDSELVIPDNDTLLGFNHNFLNLIQKKEENHQQIQSLMKIRDTLLPRLMRGGLRVEFFK